MIHLRSFVLLLLAASLGGCNAGRSGVVPSSVGYETRPMQSDSKGPWMLQAAKSEDLLYITNIDSGVAVYAYPKGELVGTLTGFSTPYGLCVDKAGDVFVANFGGQAVVEYTHGATRPVATLPTNGSPFGCSVDPVGR